MSSSSEEDITWIQSFLSRHENLYFCEVDKPYIEDAFNLYGLREIIPDYRENMRIILDKTDSIADEEFTSNCIDLYGLIHARFILTSRGLEKMHKKFLRGEFGFCPRDSCNRQNVLPIGLYDDLRKKAVRVYCAKCQDVYLPSSTQDYRSNIDGAYFGSTFAHLFYLTFPKLKPDIATVETSRYVPRVFGYRIRNGLNMNMNINNERIQSVSKNNINTNNNNIQKNKNETEITTEKQQFNIIENPSPIAGTNKRRRA